MLIDIYVPLFGVSASSTVTVEHYVTLDSSKDVMDTAHVRIFARIDPFSFARADTRQIDLYIVRLECAGGDSIFRIVRCHGQIVGGCESGGVGLVEIFVT